MNTRELAAAYVLGELDDARRAEVERRLPEDAELRAEVEAMRPLMAGLEELPAAAWPQGENPRAEAPRGRVWSFRPAVAVACLVLALLVGSGFGALLGGGGDSDSSEGGPTIALQPLAGPSGEGATVSMPSPDEMVLKVHGLPPSGSGEFYELWLLGADEETVPVASFQVGEDGSGTVRVPLPDDPGRYVYFDVSRELVDGDLEHSGDSLLRGPTTPS